MIWPNLNILDQNHGQDESNNSDGSKGSGSCWVRSALAALPYEALIIHRSSYFDYPPGISLRTCSAEDLVVLKAFAGRAQDWADIERVIVRQTGKLNWSYIHEQLRPLAELKDAPEILDQLEARRIEFER